jgi:nitroimidazol reductase NimA-like FMN-containing flavoprotein (pyridoxamine 5'-phosphate oxidase superfamily)
VPHSPSAVPADAPVVATTAAVIGALGCDEARALLARHRVGRIAFAFHDHVDIEPIHYVLDGDWIYGRTSIGTKLAALTHRPWCAFEVDEVHDTFDWASVVVKGSFHLLDPLVSSDAYERALAHARQLVPTSFAAGDPVPHRTVLFRIHVDELTGRIARPSSDD